ncbi:MAG: tetratricopeptide repeat protein, partial [Moorea sp. SIO2B7]|nr:tetratricopeptide repeat protein [Moorena sp. SIO2B7]
SSDKTARVHWSDPNDLIEEACRRLRRNFSASKWKTYVDANLSNYELTCPNRPPHKSLLYEAANFIRNDEVKKARAILQRVQYLETKRVQTYPALEITPLDLNPKTKEIEQDIELVISQIKAEVKVEEARKLASQGNYQKAISLFQKAQQLDPDVDLNPDTKELEQDAQTIAKTLAAPAKIAGGVKLARKGEIDQAIKLFQEAQRLDPKIKIDSKSWQALCWNGQLHNESSKVKFACDKTDVKTPLPEKNLKN